ncbi:MAG: transporter substrate-binding domain-containing protein [bacterium]|nr:transporter substrate-binding domain-containing protein [Gammaproteobacteria bacterium]HIL97823.1 transporter substrate-binding domain-containing protein [Pseudomonadales bacterium]
MRIRSLLCCILFSLFACLPTFADTQVKPLRVGMFTEFEPLVFLISAEIQGVEVDFARLVSEALGRPLEIETLPFAELIPALTANRIDVVMSGLSVTRERQKRVNYTDPYMEIGQMAIVRLEDAQSLGKLNALTKDGLKIGVQIDTTGEAYVRRSYRTANVLPYIGVESGLQALREGNIQVFVHDSTTSWQLGRSFVNDNLISLNKFLTRESIAWAVRKEDQDLLIAINLVLERLKAEGRVNEVLNRWLPQVRVAS